MGERVAPPPGTRQRATPAGWWKVAWAMTRRRGAPAERRRLRRLEEVVRAEKETEKERTEMERKVKMEQLKAAGA